MKLRPATPVDVDFLVELYGDEDVRPFLAGGGRYDRGALLEEIERLEESRRAGRCSWWRWTASAPAR